MKDFIFWRKVARVVMQLSRTLDISPRRALVLFYSTRTCRMLHDFELQLQCMSDTYIVNDVISEIREHGVSMAAPHDSSDSSK